MELINLTS